MDVDRINVFCSEPRLDIDGKNLSRNLHVIFGKEVFSDCISVKSYLITGISDSAELEDAARMLFCDPVSEYYFINGYPEFEFDFAFEIGFRMGVTDNIAHTAVNGIRDLLDRKDTIHVSAASSKVYFIRTNLTCGEVTGIIKQYLCNELIERFECISNDEWKNGKRFNNSLPAFDFSFEKAYESISLECSDDELCALSRNRVLSLSLSEMKVIRDYYRNSETAAARKESGLSADPTDVELEVLAQTWSEHCKHKIFAAQITYYENEKKTKVIHSLYKSYIKETTRQLRNTRTDLLSVFSDNAGIAVFDDNYAYCMKVETHNSPSALDPYGGAMTGIVGVNRDIIGTGMGAKPVFNTDVFCFASPYFEGNIPPKLMHPRRIFQGVHRGIRDGGNESGIPTVNGAIVFDERFLGKPLVFCGTGGIIPLRIGEHPSHEKRIENGDIIVMLGGRIGKDGIHGATFSSVALTETSPTSAVQIGDPITQKKMLDFIIEARDMGFYKGITDNGAGGLSSSLGEMATACGGCTIELDKAPLKYNGLQPWEILISEAQERMSLAVAPDKTEALLTLARLRDVEATVLGSFNDSGFFTATFHNAIVCKLSMTFMHEGLPGLQLSARWEKPVHSEPSAALIETENYSSVLEKLMGRLNIATKEYWVRQYDHEVQAGSVIKPFCGINADGPSDAAVIRPVFGSKKGLVVSCGILPRYSDIDTYHMASCVVDEAMRGLVASGGDPDRASGLDNFCWPDPVEAMDNPDGSYKLAQLVRCCEGLRDTCLAYTLPLISGKDSMKNDYRNAGIKISIPPTLLFTAVTLIDNIDNAVTTDFKQAGNTIFFLGTPSDNLGGSEIFSMLGYTGNAVPEVHTGRNIKLYRLLHKAMQKKLVSSCHDISEGGLAAALTESAIGGRLGCQVSIHNPGTVSRAAWLFAETPGCFIAEVSKENIDEFRNIMKKTEYTEIGSVCQEKQIHIDFSGITVIKNDLDNLHAVWQRALSF